MKRNAKAQREVKQDANGESRNKVCSISVFSKLSVFALMCDCFKLGMGPIAVQSAVI